MLGDVSGWVALDEQIEEPRLVVAGDWSVGADNLLLDGSAICKGLWQRGGDGDVLADWETEDGGWSWERETVDGGVVRQNGLLRKLEVLELLL